VQHLGAKPLDVALTRRVHFAKKLLDETRLAMCDVAFAAYGALLLRRHAASHGIATERPAIPPRTSRGERVPHRLEDQWPIELTEG
jgi:AraC family transcriptional regulator of adaptative response / DNA-3-methyladenine glycosylase II